jgi:hypothetical protein
VTKTELPVLRAQLEAERQRTADAATELAKLRMAIGAREPSVVELMAAAGFLHNVYNGLENGMSRVAHSIDESIPTGSDWHRLLVDQMSAPIASIRPALLTRPLAMRMDEYRRFRHAFRHMYFFDLAWDRLEPLVSAAPQLIGDFNGALDTLLARLTK